MDFFLGLLAGVAALFIAFSTERDDTASKPDSSSQTERENVVGDAVPGLEDNLDRPEIHVDGNAGSVVIVDSFPSESQLDIQEWRGLGGSAGAEAPRQAIATTPVWLLPTILDQIAELGVQRLVCFSTTSVLGKAGSSTSHEKVVVERVCDA